MLLSKLVFRQNTSYEQPVCPRPHRDSTNITRARQCSWVINSWFHQAQNAQQNQFFPHDKFVNEPFLVCKKSFYFFWSEHRNVGLSRFRICGLFSTFRFQLLCKLLHFWCLPRMPFLILGFVVPHTACKITEVTNRLFVTISDKVVAIWRNWPKHEVGLQQNTASSLPVRLTPSSSSLSLFRIQDSLSSPIFVSLKRSCMAGPWGLFSPGDLWQGTLTWESYYRGRQNVGADKKDQPTKRQNMIIEQLSCLGWQYTDINMTYGLGNNLYSRPC